MKRFLKLVTAALAEAHERRARRAALQQLDAHTLRDIGLEQEADRARRKAARGRLEFSPHY